MKIELDLSLFDYLVTTNGGTELYMWERSSKSELAIINLDGVTLSVEHKGKDFDLKEKVKAVELVEELCTKIKESEKFSNEEKERALKWLKSI